MASRFRQFSILAVFSLLTVAGNSQFFTTATPTISLSLGNVDGSTPMFVAWHPDFDQYYGGRGGSTTYGGRVWDAAGNIVQTLAPINNDLRSIYYNSNSSNLETIAYNSRFNSSGYRTVVLDSNGLFTGNYTNIGVTLSGIPDSQPAPVYDAARNLLYAFNTSSTVTVISPTTGLSVSTITLDVSAAGYPSLPNYAIGYDAYHDAFITYTTTGGARALAFSATTGDFLASIALPGSIDAPYDWRMSYTNDQLFIYNSLPIVIRDSASQPCRNLLQSACWFSA
jgi:hypothetical protein|uniref:hypothetical protein n=1 Tax=Cephaloticoccus sp. TaxID=1985742 RepID=UPI00404A19A1